MLIDENMDDFELDHFVKRLIALRGHQDAKMAIRMSEADQSFKERCYVCIDKVSGVDEDFAPGNREFNTACTKN
jgi:hypothetical protein